jgi:hypothetical protein
MKRWMLGVLMVFGLALAGVGAGIAWADPDAGVVKIAADAGPAVAAVLPNPDNSDAFLKSVFDAVMSKNWMWTGALGVIALVWLIRKFGAKKLPFLATDRGGALLVMVTSLLGAAATALGAGKPITGDVFRQALMLGFMGAGGFTWVKRMLGSGPPKA